MRRLNPSEYNIFIDAIGHSPKTAITIHHLRQNLCDVYFIGEPDNFKAAVVQLTQFPYEPTVFGTDAEATWEIFSQMDTWNVINLEPEMADDLETIMQREMGIPMRRYGDIYYHLTSPIEYMPPAEDIEVRLLSPDDYDMVQSARVELQTESFGSIESTLKKGITAAAMVDNQIIATANSRIADKYIDVGVFTHEDWRKKGLSTAASSLVIIEGQKLSLIPTWSTGEDNYASMRVAEKLGFEKVS